MLKPEEITVGRRNFLKAGAALPAVGAYAFASKSAEPVNVAWIGTGGQGRVLLDNADYSYIRVQALADIRPDFRELGADIVRKKSNKEVRVYDDYTQMLADGGFEAVVIATPLSTHAPIALKCMEAGMHVLCEKTMAYTLEECIEMVETARKKNLVLAVGHQRHANPLYIQTKMMMEPSPGPDDTTLDPILGDVFHIRSLWHRNNSWRRSPRGEMKNGILKEKFDEFPIDGIAKMMGKTADEEFEKSFYSTTEQEQFAAYFKWLAQKDEGFDFAKWGYDEPDALGNWRLHKELSHGLMSELGSHQIDVCNWFWGAEPEYVMGDGGLFKYKDGRDVDDHVFASFRYPNDKVMTFTSITTNKHDHYYDQVMGTKGTVYLTGEKDAMVFSETGGKLGSMDFSAVKAGAGASSASGSRAKDMAGSAASGNSMGGMDNPFLPYQYEINRFAEAIRKGDPTLVGCDGMGGLKAAVAVLKANEAIAEKQVKHIDVPAIV